MREILDPLVTVLEEEAARYRTLSKLAVDQQEFLVSGNHEALAGNVRAQEKEVFALQPLTSRRVELLAKLAKASGLKSLDLEGALKQVSGEEGEAFRKAAQELVRCAKQLEGANKGNEKLLQNAVSYVNFSLKVLANGGKKHTTLAAVTAEKETPSLINRVV